MKSSTADTRCQPGGAPDPGSGLSRSGATTAPFGPTLALSIAFVYAGFLAAMGALLLVDHPVPIPGLPLQQNQDAETLLYLGSFVVILPISLVLGSRLADRIAAGPNGPALSTLTAALGAGLALALILVKASVLFTWGDTVGVALAAALAWWIAAAVAIRRAGQARPWEGLLNLAPSAAAVWAACGVLSFIVLLCLTNLASVSLLGAVIGVALLVAVLGAYDRLRPPALGRGWRIAIDILLLGLILLAVPDLIVAQPEQAPGSLPISLQTSIIQFHQNFLLGPANEVLAGRPMLIETASQYGVGLIYLLAAWFKLVPIGYGTLGLLSGMATALAFGAGYCILRIAGACRLLAASALLVGVVTLIFNTSYPVDSIPQDSTLRFGVPMAALLALVAAQRWPARYGLAWGFALAVTGISAIYSFEAFAYTLFTVAAMACMEAWLLPAGARLAWLIRRGLLIAAACVIAHAVFALATLAAAGQLPDWGQYIAYLRAFLLDRLGDLNYDFARWSPGLAVGAAYLGSVAGIVIAIQRLPDLVRSERCAFIALAGATAYGTAIYSYYDNRSSDFALAGVALPALLVGALWLSLLMRSRAISSRRARLGGLAFAVSAAVLLVSVGWSSIGGRYPHSALAHVIPGGQSLPDALRRLKHMPPLNTHSPEGERLLERYMPNERRSLVLMTPDLETEILIRTQRGNSLPIAAPWQDSFVASQRLPGLRRGVDDLRPGRRMLIDAPVREAIAAFRANPSINPLTKLPARGRFTPVPAELAPLQAWALKRIGERFDLRRVHRGADGLEVVELAPRP